jgi:uncharacterized protein YcbK (DUF882 family)
MPRPAILKPQLLRRLALLLPLGALPFLKVAFGPRIRAAFSGPVAPPLRAELVNVPNRSNGAPPPVSFDSVTGRSGQVRVMLLSGDEVQAYPALIKRFGKAALSPGIRSVSFLSGADQFSFITLKPWRDKRGTFVNTYHVGWWPGERNLMPANYRNPAGFVEVTPENQDTRVSTHLFLRDFITHDQEQIWPKYVVLREELLDKLELVLATLQAQGVQTRHVVVLSGFRTPQYNLRATFEGAAYASRHQYGDAADVIIDADGDGRMDDLNHDGVVDFHDTDVIERAVEHVEHQYPELVGGLGLYHAVGPRGPFAHIDVRGTRARWTNAVAAGRVARYLAAGPAQTAAVGKCKADPEFAALCAGIR